jgi:hypothetical protein
MNDIHSQFGIGTTHLVLQVLLILHLCLWVVAVLRVARSIRGFAALGWIVIGLLIPFIGPVAAMIAARNHLAHAKS